MEKNKALLIEKSGIPELQQQLAQCLAKVPNVRAFEKTQIVHNIQTRLTQLKAETQQQIDNLSEYLSQTRASFERDLANILEKIQTDLHPIMIVDGKDASLEAESFASKYQLTAGKKDRNRIQVAYSRACIDINSHLIRYGVVGLPESQRTNVRSLDTVIVAVMGISVKLRRELNLIFFQPSGRQRLQREFAHYFEVSDERMANKQRLHEYQQHLEQIQTALTAVAELEAM